jgi:hypothetical protein
MPAPVRTVVSATGPEAAEWEGVRSSPQRDRDHDGPDNPSAGQASTQTPSWRARPSTSSRRRLTAATRSDHHASLRWIPR